MSDSALRELADDPSSRKRFLKMVGGAGAVSAFGILLAACGDDEEEDSGGGASAPPEESGGGGGSMEGDLKILNYALTLEHLEAGFYKEAIASGQIKDKAIGEVAKKFGQTEEDHVNALTKTIEDLGGTPVKAPATNFGPTIEKGPDAILETAALVENLGAAAYLGAAPKIMNKDILAAALGIHSVEARHAAALNQVIMAGFKGDGPLVGTIPDGAFAKGMDEEAVLKAVQPFLA